MAGQRGEELSGVRAVRRPGAAARAAALGLEAVDPDNPTFEFDAEGSAAPATPAEPATNISPAWLDAARATGMTGTDDEVGNAVFHALIAVAYSPEWLALQPIQRDDFPGAAVPADPTALLAAATTGKRIALLSDTDAPVPGVTTGAIDSRWAAVGAPDNAGDPVLKEGRLAFHGGLYDPASETVFWDQEADQGWRGVPEDVWQFAVAGYQILPRYLSYRVGTALTEAERRNVFHLCRRIAALIALQDDCDTAHASALRAPLLTEAVDVSADLDTHGLGAATGEASPLPTP